MLARRTAPARQGHGRAPGRPRPAAPPRGQRTRSVGAHDPEPNLCRIDVVWPATTLTVATNGAKSSLRTTIWCRPSARVSSVSGGAVPEAAPSTSTWPQGLIASRTRPVAATAGVRRQAVASRLAPASRACARWADSFGARPASAAAALRPCARARGRVGSPVAALTGSGGARAGQRRRRHDARAAAALPAPRVVRAGRQGRRDRCRGGVGRRRAAATAAAPASRRGVGVDRRGRRHRGAGRRRRGTGGRRRRTSAVAFGAACRTTVAGGAACGLPPDGRGRDRDDRQRRRRRSRAHGGAAPAMARARHRRRQRFAFRAHRVGIEPVAQLAGERAGRAVALLRVLRHRPGGDLGQRLRHRLVDLAGERRLVLEHGLGDRLRATRRRTAWCRSAARRARRRARTRRRAGRPAPGAPARAPCSRASRRRVIGCRRCRAGARRGRCRSRAPAAGCGRP